MTSLHTRVTGLLTGALTLAGAAFAQGGDTCSVPTAISGTGTWLYDTSTATTSGFDGGSGGVGCYNNINKDLFFAWTAPSTGNYFIDTEGSAYDTKINVHAGGDCNATCIDGDDDSGTGLLSLVLLSNVTAGDVFLLQVGGFGSASGPAQFNVTLAPPPPANDTCATPDTTTLVGTGSFPFDCTSAGTSGFNGGGNCTTFGTMQADVFLTWTAPAADDYSINTLASVFNTTLAVHSGSDCNATCLAYNDNAPGVTQSEVILLGVNAGDTFLIQIGNTVPLSAGAGTLDIAPWVDPCAVAPDAFEPNDACANAVPVGDGLYTGLNVSRFNSDFYSFTVADGATLNADIFFIDANADTDFFLYDASVCLDDPNSGTAGSLANGFSVTDNETLSWTNNTGADLPCVLRVNIWPGTVGDCNDYDLQLSGAGPGGPALFCDPANVNSSGNSVTLASSDFSGPGVVHLEATGGPSGQFGYFLVSGTALDPGVPVSQGLICVGAPQGRYNGVGGVSSIGQFSAGGVLNNIVGTSSVGTGFDVPASLPNPPGGVITPGSTYHFQLWYRDGVNSNFSNGLTVVFP